MLSRYCPENRQRKWNNTCAQSFGKTQNRRLAIDKRRSGNNFRFGSNCINLGNRPKPTGTLKYRTRRFSLRVCLPIAVEDSANIKPIARAMVHACPNSIATATTVTPTCRPPNANISDRITHNTFGCISKPIRNSIMTTSNSVKCCRAATFIPAHCGTDPIAIPAIKYSRTDPSQKREASETANIPARKIVKVMTINSTVMGPRIRLPQENPATIRPNCCDGSLRARQRRC